MVLGFEKASEREEKERFDEKNAKHV